MTGLHDWTGRRHSGQPPVPTTSSNLVRGRPTNAGAFVLVDQTLRSRKSRNCSAAATVSNVRSTMMDARRLRERILDALRHVMRVDAYAFVMTDPESEVGVDPLAEVPCLPELPSLIRLKYLTEVNRWTSLTSAAGLREATGDQLDSSLVWRELLRRYGIGDVASMVFRDRFGCWGFLDTWRGGADARFEAAELRILTRIAEPVTRALRRAQASTLLERPMRRPGTGPVVLLLSEQLEVRAQTPQTLDYLSTLLPPTPDAPPVPAVAYNTAAQLLAVEAGVDAHPPVARVHRRPGRLWGADELEPAHQQRQDGDRERIAEHRGAQRDRGAGRDQQPAEEQPGELVAQRLRRRHEGVGPSTRGAIAAKIAKLEAASGGDE